MLLILLKTIVVSKDAYPNLIVYLPKLPRRTQRELMNETNPLICQQSHLPSPVTPLEFKLMTSALIPLVEPQMPSTLLKTIVVKKDAYPNFIIHSPKYPRHTQGEFDGCDQPFDLPTISFF